MCRPCVKTAVFTLKLHQNTNKRLPHQQVRCPDFEDRANSYLLQNISLEFEKSDSNRRVYIPTGQATTSNEVKKTLLPSSENDTTDTDTFLRKNILLHTTKVCSRGILMEIIQKNATTQKTHTHTHGR